MVSTLDERLMDGVHDELWSAPLYPEKNALYTDLTPTDDDDDKTKAQRRRRTLRDLLTGDNHKDLFQRPWNFDGFKMPLQTSKIRRRPAVRHHRYIGCRGKEDGALFRRGERVLSDGRRRCLSDFVDERTKRNMAILKMHKVPAQLTPEELECDTSRVPTISIVNPAPLVPRYRNMTHGGNVRRHAFPPSSHQMHMTAKEWHQMHRIVHDNVWKSRCCVRHNASPLTLPTDQIKSKKSSDALSTKAKVTIDVVSPKNRPISQESNDSFAGVESNKTLTRSSEALVRRRSSRPLYPVVALTPTAPTEPEPAVVNSSAGPDDIEATLYNMMDLNLKEGRFPATEDFLEQTRAISAIEQGRPRTFASQFKGEGRQMKRRQPPFGAMTLFRSKTIGNSLVHHNCQTLEEETQRVAQVVYSKSKKYCISLKGEKASLARKPFNVADRTTYRRKAPSKSSYVYDDRHAYMTNASTFYEAGDERPVVTDVLDVKKTRGDRLPTFTNLVDTWTPEQQTYYSFLVGSRYNHGSTIDEKVRRQQGVFLSRKNEGTVLLQDYPTQEQMEERFRKDKERRVAREDQERELGVMRPATTPGHLLLNMESTQHKSMLSKAPPPQKRFSEDA